MRAADIVARLPLPSTELSTCVGGEGRVHVSSQSSEVGAQPVAGSLFGDHRRHSSKPKVRSSSIGLLLDRYMGSIILRLVSAFRPPRALMPHPRRIGISVLGAIGDTIVASALGLDIRRALPSVHITLIASDSNRSIAAVLPAFDDVLSVPTGRIDIAARQVRLAGFDVLIDCNQWLRLSALHAAFAGCTTIGFRTPGQARHFAYDHAVDHLSDRHELDNYRALLAPLGIEPKALPELAVSAAAYDAVAPFLARPKELGTIIFHPWAGGRNGVMKEWPDARWVELGMALRKRGYRIHVTGSGADRARTNALTAIAASNGVELNSLAGAIPLDQLAALLARADAVVSVNTGIMHLAAAAGARVVALNGPVNPLRWGPLTGQSISLSPIGMPSGYLHLGFEYPSKAPDCMAGISAAAALQAVLRLIGRECESNAGLVLEDMAIGAGVVASTHGEQSGRERLRVE